METLYVRMVPASRPAPFTPADWTLNSVGAVVEGRGGLSRLSSELVDLQPERLGLRGQGFSFEKRLGRETGLRETCLSTAHSVACTMCTASCSGAWGQQ